MTFRPGVVIPVGPDREANLGLVLHCLATQTLKPAAIVLVQDGPVALPPGDYIAATAPKHRPGMEQPRNIGVRGLPADCTHVWFLDTDIVFGPDTLQAFADACKANPEPRILVGPYDWLAPSVRDVPPLTMPRDHPNIDHADDRWNAFDAHPPEEVTYNPTGSGPACFSGNLVWPIDEFWRVGGFWSEMHHGRCEDGELGIRAVAAGVGVSFVAKARGFHLWHPVNMDWVLATNAQDVPKINKRHVFLPDAAQYGDNRGPHLLMAAKDGIRFDFKCPTCGGRFNSLSYWSHCGGPDWACTAPRAA
jgi:hypothetical protein